MWKGISTSKIIYPALFIGQACVRNLIVDPKITCDFSVFSLVYSYEQRCTDNESQMKKLGERGSRHSAPKVLARNRSRTRIFGHHDIYETLAFTGNSGMHPLPGCHKGNTTLFHLSHLHISSRTGMQGDSM